MGYTFFDFLSAIDWLPSPFGRDMDAQEDLAVSGAAAKEPGADRPRATPAARPASRCSPASTASVRAMGINFKADVARRRPERRHLELGVRRCQLARARDLRRCSGSTSTGHPNLIKLYLPTDFEGHPLRKDFPLLARRVRPWPGIVDVEPMPGGAAGDGEGEGE